MKFLTLGAVVALISITGCTTVDLSQVAVEKQAVSSVPLEQNVVERACSAMASIFDGKGWSHSDPKQKMQTATSVLLNGREKEAKPKTNIFKNLVSARQLSQDMKLAQVQIEQTTKAAEIYLVTSQENAAIERELSLLETALLSARQVETRFETALLRAHKPLSTQGFVSLQHEINQLKLITNSYGARIRSQIASQSSTDKT